MRPFKYSGGNDVTNATKMLLANPHAKLLAGGTNLLDLMKEDVERPNELIDLNRAGFNEIKLINEGLLKGGVSIGGAAKNSDTANDNIIRQNYPLLTQAILAGASAQIRNMASNAGNINQRTRCTYFYDTAMPCNKREPGTGCGALKGENRMHVIFGWSANCVAVHPSDMCVTLAALNATIKVQGSDEKQRSIPFFDYHRLPGNTPQTDNSLKNDEVIIAIEIPPNNFANHSYYLKIRDRSSYAFALISVAAALEMETGKIKEARIAMGGVAHKPWRAAMAEKYLKGKAATEANFKLAAEKEMALAKPLEHNKFKVEMGKKAIVRALMQATAGADNI